MELQEALQETGIAQVEYDGYTATVRDDEGEFGDKYLLSIQKDGMPPFYQEYHNELFQVSQYMNSTHCPKPIQWQPVDPE